MRHHPFALAALLAVALAGCASNLSGASYSHGQARQEMTVRQGTVDTVRPVTIEGRREEGIGPLAGAVLGGLAGSNVGKGRGAAAATVLGAVAGGVAGSAIEESLTSKQGQEVTVKLDSGQLVAVVQEADEAFHPGDRVRVLTGSGASRVTH